MITAARLSSAATDGQILLSPRSHDEIDGLVEVESIGELTLKGFSRPISPMNVIGLRENVEAAAVNAS